MAEILTSPSGITRVHVTIPEVPDHSPLKIYKSQVFLKNEKQTDLPEVKLNGKKI